MTTRPEIVFTCAQNATKLLCMFAFCALVFCMCAMRALAFCVLGQCTCAGACSRATCRHVRASSCRLPHRLACLWRHVASFVSDVAHASVDMLLIAQCLNAKTLHCTAVSPACTHAHTLRRALHCMFLVLALTGPRIPFASCFLHYIKRLRPTHPARFSHASISLGGLTVTVRRNPS